VVRDPKTKRRDRSRAITKKAFGALLLAYGIPQPENTNCQTSNPTQETSDMSETSETSDSCEDKESFTDGQKALSYRLITNPLITNPTQVPAMLAKVKQAVRFGLDIETSGPGKDGALDPHKGRIELVQISTGEDTWVIDGQTVPLELLREVLEGGPTKVIHNSSFEAGFLNAIGITVAPVVDTLVLGRIAKVWGYGPDGGSFELKDMTAELLGITLENKTEYQRSDWSRRPLSQEQLDYAAQDTWVLPYLLQVLEQSIEDQGLQNIAALEERILPMVNAMSQEGIRLDWDAWVSLAETVAQEKIPAKAEVDAIVKALPDRLLPQYQANLQRVKAVTAQKKAGKKGKGK
jgi:3'-5' exonuclease